jgi:hypothetical protein
MQNMKVPSKTHHVHSGRYYKMYTVYADMHQTWKVLEASYQDHKLAIEYLFNLLGQYFHGEEYKKISTRDLTVEELSILKKKIKKNMVNNIIQFSINTSVFTVNNFRAYPRVESIPFNSWPTVNF